MEVGDLVSEQFKILSLAGVGGMGKVYRALDTKSNSEVALKLLTLDPSKYSRRFMREAKVMSRLRHKNIIEYLGYGQTLSGAPYIVMEWVSGEDLRQRMNRLPISLDEALAIIAGLGDALALADKQGVIHRDLKPSNLMLVDGKVDVIKLLDFGIARGSDPDLERMTKTGVSIGTPGYMAPEQSRGESEIDGRADLYALGCVVYETLVGQRPFRGEDIVAVLARGAIEEPPRVSAHRTDISQAFDDLLAEMMAFRPEQRPINGSKAAMRAAAIPSTRTIPSKVSESSSDFGHSEQEPTGIILCNVDLRAHVLLIADNFEKTEHKVEHFDNGTSVILLHAPGKSSEELLYLCAHHTLALHQQLAETSFFLRVEFADWQDPRMPRNAMNRSVVARADLTPLPGIEIDENIARSICARYHLTKLLSSDTIRYRLDHEHQTSTESFQRQHDLLGPRTKIVGREKEMSWLPSIFAKSVADNTLKIALLSGRAGIGKSRLREWFTDEVIRSHPNTRFWYARCTSSSSPYNLVGALISQASGHRKGDSRVERRDKLHALVSGAVATERVEHICEFVGELCDTSFVADSNRSILLAARGNPAMMRNQVLGAWRELFSALAAVTPLVLILEDLQYIDTESQQALGSVLLSSSDKSLTVLALSRIQHSSLWSELNIERQPLSGLSEQESVTFAQSLCSAGKQLQPHLLHQANGNPATIEELAFTANPGDTKIPISVLLRCYTDVSSLPKEHKRFLRAASVLGHESPLSCVSYLLGETNVASHDSVLSELVQHKILTSSKDDSGARRIAFANEFTRRAVYASLNAEDKVLGHRRTADWIAESWVNRSADLPLDVCLSLGYHQVQSNQCELAVANYCRAATLELQAVHISQAINIAHKALALSPPKAPQFQLQAILATTYLWSGRNDLASEYGASALESTARTSEAWPRTSADTIIALMRCGATMDMQPVLDNLLASDPAMAPDAFVQAVARSFASLCQMGKYGGAAPLLECLAHYWDSGNAQKLSEETQGHLAIARAYSDLSLGHPESHFLNLQRAIHLLSSTSQIEPRISAHIALGSAHAKLGEWRQAESSLRQSLEACISHQVPYATAECHQRLGQVYLASGNYDEARDQLNTAIRAFSRQKNEGQEHCARVYLSQTYQNAGVLGTAEELARKALGGTNTMAQIRMLANAQLASILVEQGRSEEALHCARESYEILSLLKPVPEGRMLVSLSFIESLFQCEHNERAILALKLAHGELLRSTNLIKDPGRKLSYVEQVPENARLVSLAVKWDIDKEMVSQS